MTKLSTAGPLSCPVHIAQFTIGHLLCMRAGNLKGLNMKSVVLGLVLSVFVNFFMAPVSSAYAQDRLHDKQPYQVAQVGYEIYIDNRGRRYLIDPETGEAVGRANRNARFSRNDKNRVQRELRKLERRGRLEQEINGLFEIFPNREQRQDRLSRRRQRDDGYFLRKRGSRNRASNDRRYFNRETDQQPPSATTQEEEVARLPGYNQPVKRVPSPNGLRKPKFNTAQMTRLQVFLDREGFSPGVIDGKWGSNVSKAAASWKQSTGSNADLRNATTLNKLAARSGGDVFASHTITAKDTSGPFVKNVPADYAKKAELESLSYTSVLEMLAEKFHMSQTYLRKLNPGKNFNRAGTTIQVVSPGSVATQKVHYIIADKSRKQVRTYGRNGKLVTAYPATIGSVATPSPTGTHEVARIAVNPDYTYNPKVNFQQGKNDKILRIPPGPNGPVGSVWIALSKPTYGIHGTPNPSTIGKTNSHGCIRLTNWDALELVKLVTKGVTVEFVE